MADSAAIPGSVTAAGPRSVAAGGDISGSVFTGDVGNIFVGGYERLEEVRQYADGLVAELDLAHFTGRRWLVDLVDEFVRSEDRGYFVLEADAGLGKTTFCAWLAGRRGYPVHFAGIPGGADPTAALTNLAAQLIDAYRLDEVAPGGVVPPAAARPDGFARLLAAAARQAQQAATPLVLVVDGLDEVPYRVGEMPLGLPASPPPGVHLVVSRRPGDRMLPIEAPRRYVSVPAWAEPEQSPVPNQQDMLDYLRRVVAEPPLSSLLADSELHAEVFVDQLAAKCAGVWIYLRYVLEEMRHRRRAVADLVTLPDTLWQYYAHTFAVTRQEDPDRWQAVLLPLLATLCAAAEPVTFDVLCTLAGVQADARWRAVLDGPWRAFLQVQDAGLDVEPRYAVYHISLREFLDGRLSAEALAQMSAERPLIRQLHQALQERHSQIADHYLSAWGGLATNLAILHPPAAGLVHDGYGLRHLAHHLHGAGREPDLHRLLACQRIAPAVDPGISPRQVNVWFTARDQAGDLAGYLRDVQLAWQVATVAARDEIRSGGSTTDLGLEIRYALITASMVSLAAALPIPLIIALTEHRLWSPAQALAYSRQLPNPAQRATCLAVLRPVLPPNQHHPVLAEALATARQLTTEDSRARVLAALAPHLPADLLAEALATARQLTDQDTQARILAALAPYLSEPLLQEALIAARAIADEDTRAQALAALAPHLSEHLLQEALAAARAIANENSRARALTLLAPQLSEPSRETALQEALAAAEGISWEYGRAQSLAALAPHLSEPLQRIALQEALTAARAIATEHDRARALAALAPHLSNPLLEEALAVARTIADEDARVHALAALASHLSEPLLQEALATVRALSISRKGTVREDALLKLLAPHLSEPLLQEALAAVRTIANEDGRAWALTALAPHLSERLLQEALTAARGIAKEDAQAQALAALAPHLSERLLQEALTAARAIAWKYWRAEALAALAPHLSEPLQGMVLQDVVTAARAIADDYSRAWQLRAWALAGLSAPLSEPLLEEALIAARAIADEGLRAGTLAGLAPHLSEHLLQEALAAARAIANENSRARALTLLAPHLTEASRETTLHEALTAARAIADEDDRARVLATLAPPFTVTEPLQGTALEEALTAARAIKGRYYRVQALAVIAPHLGHVPWSGGIEGVVVMLSDGVRAGR